MSDEPLPRTASCLRIGCGGVLCSAALGVVVFVVANVLTPCRCEGEPDYAFAEMANAIPYGVSAFLLGLVVTAGVYAYRYGRSYD